LPKNPYREKSNHQQAVELFLKGAGHDIPDRPMLAPQKKLIAQVKILFEEALELADAVGIDVLVDEIPITKNSLEFDADINESDFVDVVDGACDVMVVATGFLSLCGVSDVGVQAEVDTNNLLKLDGGKMNGAGKFKKPKGHPRPELKARLLEQGWQKPIGE
jgi:predicted HAD superfamily Cof-like phosphohydrolase